MAVVCYKCSKTLELVAGTNIPKSEECLSCMTDLHCCRMCEFYDPKHYNECREPSAERVVEKEKANYCDFFKIVDKSASSDPVKSAIDAANALFKK
ncbi:MAG: hypothetical protein ACOYL6_05185 [Bacteriovoracaceae bacterium]